MLKATAELIEAGAGANGIGWQRAGELVRVIGRFGATDDAAALVGHFLADPANNEHVLPVVESRGDPEMALRLLDATTDAGGLLPGMPAGLLQTFGYHGLANAKALLWGYARADAAWRSDNLHSTSTAAAHGLLHLPCDELAGAIEAEIRECVGQNVFPEYLPALAARTGRPDLLDVIWKIAETASTDCNGGLILGTALYGERGRVRFHELMWSSDWDAASGSTGSVNALFAGTCILAMPMAEIVAEWKRRLAAGERALHGFVLVEALLDARLRTWHTGLRFAPAPAGSMTGLHEELFRSSTALEDDAFPAVARRALDRDGYPFTDAVVDRVEAREAVVLARVAEDLLLREWSA